jgi:hypothetical protein
MFNNKNIFAFIDLDNTLFQRESKTKNIETSIIGSWDKEGNPFSYIEKYQQHFFEMLYNNKNIQLIPTTARTLEQYQRTFLSKNFKIDTGILQFATKIIFNGNEDMEYKSIIEKKTNELPFKIIELEKIYIKYFEEKINKNFMYIKNLNGHLLHFRIIDEEKYKIYNDELYNEIFEILKELKIEKFYKIHLNDRYLDISGIFIDKKEGVDYFIKKYSPELTLGIGDALSDNDFMNLTDFKITPSNSQLNNFLNSKLNN